jgi:hypothetical protein
MEVVDVFGKREGGRFFTMKKYHYPKILFLCFSFCISRFFLFVFFIEKEERKD